MDIDIGGILDPDSDTFLLSLGRYVVDKVIPYDYMRTVYQVNTTTLGRRYFQSFNDDRVIVRSVLIYQCDGTSPDHFLREDFNIESIEDLLTEAISYCEGYPVRSGFGENEGSITVIFINLLAVPGIKIPGIPVGSDSL